MTAYWQDSPWGKSRLVGRIKCVACGGSGISPWAEHRHPLAGPLTAADFERLRKAIMRHAFSSRPPNGAIEIVVPAGIHDVCRVEDYDQAAEDAALLDGIADGSGDGD